MTPYRNAHCERCATLGPLFRALHLPTGSTLKVCEECFRVISNDLKASEGQLWPRQHTEPKAG